MFLLTSRAQARMQMIEATITQFNQPFSLIILIIHYRFCSTVTLAMYWARWILEKVKVKRSFHFAFPMFDNQQLDPRC